MKTQTESIILTNKEGQQLRIYKLEGEGPLLFCLGIDGDSEHFRFSADDAEYITKEVDVVVNSFI
ncbi:hypothetical protein GW796_09160 [archaeon]|nr:hypothetical protein [archaeon]NCT58899.1 hypothetical protein [archaeon]